MIDSKIVSDQAARNAILRLDGDSIRKAIVGPFVFAREYVLKYPDGHRMPKLTHAGTPRNGRTNIQVFCDELDSMRNTWPGAFAPEDEDFFAPVFAKHEAVKS